MQVSSNGKEISTLRLFEYLLYYFTVASLLLILTQQFYELPNKQTNSMQSTFHDIADRKFYKYSRPNSTVCEAHSISVKYSPHCSPDNELEPQYIKQLLVVAVQRSGTHYMWETLHQLGIHVHHEGVGPDGAVSWLYAVNAHYNSTPGIEDYGHGYVINNPDPLHKNRFRHVFYQVRHPLRVISTLLRRCAPWDRIWQWIHNLRGFEAIHDQLTPLRRAMLLYWLWNTHIERYADYRYQSEITTAEEVCVLAGFGARCTSPTPIQHHVRKGQNVTNSASSNVSYRAAPGGGNISFGSKRRRLQAEYAPGEVQTSEAVGTAQKDGRQEEELSWAQLNAEDSSLSTQLKHMCLRYGYSLDPRGTPQRSETRQFTA